MITFFERLGAARSVAPTGTDGHDRTRAPSLDILQDGGFVVAWEEVGGSTLTQIAAQRFDADAMPLGGPVALGDGAATTTVAGSQVDVETFSDGSYGVFWVQPGAAVGRRFAPGGTEITASADLYEAVEQTDPDTDETTVTPVFLRTSTTYSSNYVSGGTVISKSIFLNWPVDRPLVDTDVDVLDFDLVPQPFGAFTLAYTYLDPEINGLAREDVGLSRFAPGTEIVPETRALAPDLFTDADRANRQEDIAGATLENETRVLIWADRVLDGSSPDRLRGQIVDEGDAPVAGVFDIATETPARELLDNPVLVALEDGGFAVGYGTLEGGAGQVQVQLFDADGTARGGPVALGAPGLRSETAIDLSPVPGGGVWAAWQRFDPISGDWQIFAQMIDAAGRVVSSAQQMAISNFSLYSPDIEVRDDGTLVVAWAENSDPRPGRFAPVMEVEVQAFAPLLRGDDTDEAFDLGGSLSRIDGRGGNDTLAGSAFGDLLLGGDGRDRLIGGGGNDTLTGGTGTADLRDEIFGGDGDDIIDGGYGNDALRGDAGNDSIAGGFGADTVIGGAGDDTLTGSAFGDLLLGGDGIDFINGGFGSDRMNGGTGADRFFHLGIADHGSDWVQDYNAAQGDLLIFGGSADVSQFQLNLANTAGAGDAAVDEAFVIYRPTGQILWALVDGAGQDQVNLSLGGQVFDLA